MLLAHFLSKEVNINSFDPAPDDWLAEEGVPMLSLMLWFLFFFSFFFISSSEFLRILSNFVSELPNINSQECSKSHPLSRCKFIAFISGY